MSKTKWHSGPPPSVGWWPASCIKDPKAIRWWDGERWSLQCYESDSLECVDHAAKKWGGNSGDIQWTERPASWPARSRT